MKGSLANDDDLVWLLAWLNNGAGPKVEFRADDTLHGLEFITGHGSVTLSWYAFEILRSGACKARRAVSVDGWWVGLN